MSAPCSPQEYESILASSLDGLCNFSIGVGKDDPYEQYRGNITGFVLTNFASNIFPAIS